MKWYNYKDQWFNLEYVKLIKFKEYIYVDNSKRFVIEFTNDSTDNHESIFKTLEERDAEFAKIKNLMGIEDFTSRCC